MLADWRKRWQAALRADGMTLDLKKFGLTIHTWSVQGAYLHAVMRGEMRRNLDGSEAGVPDDEARQQAKNLLDERAARRAERERRQQERKLALSKSP